MAKKKRSTRLNGSPEYHLSKVDPNRNQAVDFFKAAQRKAESGDCRSAFDSYSKGLVSKTFARVHTQEAGVRDYDAGLESEAGRAEVLMVRNCIAKGAPQDDYIDLYGLGSKPRRRRR